MESPCATSAGPGATGAGSLGGGSELRVSQTGPTAQGAVARRTIEDQAAYCVWRQGVARPGQPRKELSQNDDNTLPAGDPGKDVIARWRQLDHGVGWWIGDWWRFCKPEWGKRAEIFNDAWQGPAYHTCRNTAAVCEAFQYARRRANLEFTHHAEVTALDPAQQDVLLDWCEAPSVALPGAAP